MSLIPWRSAWRGDGWERQDGLTAFGASSSADLVDGLVELALVSTPLQPLRMELCVHELQSRAEQEQFCACGSMTTVCSASLVGAPKGWPET